MAGQTHAATVNAVRRRTAARMQRRGGLAIIGPIQSDP